MANPVVFMEIKSGSRNMGRIEFELYADIVPRTAENFRCLCTGERGKGGLYGSTPLHFLNSTFHRIIPGFMMQGGDFTKHNGTGGVSIYGEKFRDENFMIKHNQPGLLSMANCGPNTNGSQFFITFGKAPHLDGKHTVFGKVVRGMHVVKAIERIRTGKGDKPVSSLVITDCGEIVEEKEDANDNDNQSDKKNNSDEVDDVPLKLGKKGGHHEDLSAVAPPIALIMETAQDDTSLKRSEITPLGHSKKPENMTKKQEKLWKLREKMNLARNANRAEVKAEHDRLSNPEEKRRRKKNAEIAAKRKRQKEEMAGVDHLNVTAEKAMYVSMKKAKKELNKASFGWNVFNQDSLYRAHDKRLAKMPAGSTATAQSNDTSLVKKADTEEGVEKMVSELHEHEARRSKFSRRRAHLEGEDVDYINERNHHFNKKISRAFDKYTVDIRQNLERGTAL